MTLTFWLSIVSAVFAGNVLTFAWGYFFWLCRQNERAGKDSYADIPVLVSFVCGIVPPLVAALGVYLTVGF